MSASPSEKKNWSREETLQLIEMYERNSLLWNHRMKGFRNRELKENIFKEMSNVFNCSTEEIQRKLHNLRNQVSQEVRKCKIKNSRDGTNKVYTSNWPYFKALNFLVPVLISRESKDSLLTEYVEEMWNETERQDRLEINKNIARKHKYKDDDDSTVFQERIKVLIRQPDEDEQFSQDCVESDKKLIRKQKYKYDNDTIVHEAMKVLMKQPDEDEQFGQYVAMELKGLQSDFNKKRLKTEIRKAIVRVVEEDDNLYDGSSSSSFFVNTGSSQ